MTAQTADPIAEPVRSNPPQLSGLSEWHQDQFERHLRYASSLGLRPDHARRFALQQLGAAKPRSAGTQASQ